MLSQQISGQFDAIISSSIPPLSIPPSLPLSGVTEAAVTAAAATPVSNNGQVSENRSGAALRQSSQAALSFLGTSPAI